MMQRIVLLLCVKRWAKWLISTVPSNRCCNKGSGRRNQDSEAEDLVPGLTEFRQQRRPSGPGQAHTKCHISPPSVFITKPSESCHCTVTDTEHIARVCKAFPCLFTFFFFWLCCLAGRILIPQPGIEPLPPALGAWSPNIGLPRKSPFTLLFFKTSMNK